MDDDTSDIVQRLRQEAADWICGPVVLEAASEIEQLRAGLQVIADGDGDAQEIARQTLAGPPAV